MTRFVNFRGSSYGAVCSPYVLEGDPLTDPPAMKSVLWNAVPILVRGKDVLLAAHGFNVAYASGVHSLGRLEAALQPRSGEAFFGVLWPGDWILPAINYPFEDRIASRAGQLLADFCNTWLASARSVSFLSHSLGARVILEAIRLSKRRIRRACITAGAVNANCLAEEYALAAANCDSIITLSSMQDKVLEFAYPAGDLLADVLYPDHPPFESALGRHGPTPPFASFIRAYEIADSPPYDHGDYLPPGDLKTPFPNPQANCTRSVEFMAAAFRGQAPSWPA